jgi:hypothetical protein
MNILTNNAKTDKSVDYGYITKGVHLAPANLSGYETCQWRSKGCTASCLNTAGRGAMNSVQEARIKKTKFFYEDRNGFLDKLDSEIGSADRSAKRKEMKLCLRLNLTSDERWEDTGIMHKHYDKQFYDYTKGFKRMKAFLDGQLPPNYHLTFSRSEHNHKLCKIILEMGGNVAAVFRDELPDEYEGYEVINGDEHDLRFKDKQNVWVGLTEKGLAKKDTTGFVI